jgi:hypothetical protein
LIYKARLYHAITALDVLGSVMEAVPLVAGGLKSATEDTKKIREVVKVRDPIVLPVMRSIFVPENERELQSLRGDCRSRSPALVRLLAPLANAISKANSEQLTGMEGNVLFCVLDHAIF